MTGQIPAVDALGIPEADVGESLWRGAFRRMRRRPMAIIGAIIMLLFVLVALLAPVLAPYEPASTEWTELSTPYYVQGSSADHPLGIDRYGSDMLTQLLYGARQSLIIGVIATSIGLIAGALLGTLAGGLGGRVDTLIMRFVDILLSIPALLLAISIAAAMGRNSFALMVAIGAAQVPIFARLLRGSVLAQRENDFVLAARAVGVPKRQILGAHILPNAISPVIVQGTLSLATAIIEVAGLGFLGLGPQDPSTPEWGTMLADVNRYLQTAPHLAIVISVLGFNLIGDGLREALDPKLRGRV